MEVIGANASAQCIGVKLPTRQQVITACKIIVDEKIMELLRTQSENARLIANYDLRMQYNATWAAEHGGYNNVSVLNVRATVAGGYTEKEVSESEARRLKRAANLVLNARLGNDSRAQMSVVISDDQNVQRERQLANGTTQITITTAEAEQIATKVDEAIAESGGDATVVGEKVLVAMINAGVDTGGGSDIDVSALDPTATMDEVLGWYHGTPQNEPSVSIHGTWIRNDTQAGRIFLGLYQNIWSSSDAEARLRCAKVEKITGIPQQDLWGIARSHDANRFAEGLITFFQRAGFGDIFGDTASLPPLSEAHPLRVSTDSTLYTSGSIRVSWDQPLTTNGKKVDHTRVYLVNAVTKANLMDLSGDIRGQLFTDIAISSLGQSFAGPMAVKVVDWPVGATNNAEAISGFSDPITVEWDGVENSDIGDYSTLPNTPDNSERREKENMILNQIAKTFPLEGNASEWRWVIASDYHVGTDFNAADLNWGSGNADYGKEIKAVADGVIATIGVDLGSVRIQHKSTVNGQEIIWFSEALHMPIYATDRTSSDGKKIHEVRKKDDSVAFELFEGMTLKASQSYGIVAGRGLVDNQPSNSAFDAHSHLKFELDGRSIDPRKVMTTWGVTNIVASDLGGRGEMPVRWDQNAQMWMNDEFGLTFDRSEQSDAGRDKGYWMAWAADPAQRTRVVWVTSLPDGTKINAWLKTDDYSQIWDPTLCKFVAR